MTTSRVEDENEGENMNRPNGHSDSYANMLNSAGKGRGGYPSKNPGKPSGPGRDNGP